MFLRREGGAIYPKRSLWGNTLELGECHVNLLGPIITAEVHKSIAFVREKSIEER